MILHFEEGIAENSLLNPDVSRSKLAVGVETGHLGAGAGAAGGAIKGGSRAKYEVAGRVAGGMRRAEKFYVVD